MTLKSQKEFANNSDLFRIAGRAFNSRLLVGTGRYTTLAIAKEAIEASGAEIVTVALRRVNLAESAGNSLTDYISPEKYTYLPNSAGCYTADEAVRTLRLARAGSGWNLVKLEVIGDKVSLYPDMPETIKAAEILVKDGFDVMVYCTDNAAHARRLEEIGCAAIMPLAAPIGSGLGIQNPDNIRKIVENAKVPVLVDAGIGTASDAAIAMELGCDGVLMNAAISDAQNPVQMAYAMKLAVEAGRRAYLAGRMPRRQIARASSPLEGIIGKI
jgi:thiazole synthase